MAELDSTAAAAPGSAVEAPPFADILCAVDGSRGSAAAVRAAIAIAPPAGRVVFLAISQERGSGLAAEAELSGARARDALEQAERIAHAAGLVTATRLITAERVSRALLAEARGHDLLVAGSHGGSRLGGILLGGTATQLAHQARGPLLVARPCEHEDEPPLIVLADDRTAASAPAAVVARSLSEAKGWGLVPVHAPDRADPVEHVVDAARAVGPALLVVGHRGVRGAHALGSVSERIVHRAPCSVLVVPAGRGRDEGA